MLGLALAGAAVVAVGLVTTAPFTWALMLFLGNAGFTHMGYWDCVPAGFLLGAIAGRGKTE